MINKVDIRPGVSVLAVLRHLNYRPWYALGEFVDNAIQSFNDHKSALQEIHGNNFKLCVEIEVENTTPPRILVRDNAAGISGAEYPRAFRPAAIPSNRSGLAEFGMGMKSAACWFAPRWIVRTSALGEPLERTIHFDVDKIVNDAIEELNYSDIPVDSDCHYTELILEDVFNIPKTKTIGKIKEHLTDIYREFVRRGTLELRFNHDLLVYQDPEVLKAAYYKDEHGENKIWRKNIDFDFGMGQSIKGFAALRKTANTAKAGFSLFRRGRVIQGSGDECYRPDFIFGKSNSYRYQRLIGEFHLEGFEVSHTKDGFRWDEDEQTLLELLREHLDSDELPLLKQAEGYRVRESRAKLEEITRKAVDKTARALEDGLQQFILPDVELIDSSTEEVSCKSTLANRQFDIRFRDDEWKINISLTENDINGQWITVGDRSREQPRHLDIEVSMVHPFTVRFAQANSENLEALLRVATALALGEVISRDVGVKSAASVRHKFNEILRSALSGP